MKNRFMIIFLLLMIFIKPVLAQDTCTAIVETALQQVEQACSGVGRNQVCYGNVDIQAETKTAISFASPGDVVDVTQLTRLQTAALDTASNTWGIALFQLQANVDASLPGQNVTLLLFGEVNLQPIDVPPPVTLGFTPNANPNVRNGPGTSYDVVGNLSAGVSIIANGRNEAGDWLRFSVENDETPRWVFAQLVSVDGDIALLPVVNVGEPVQQAARPLQAFYFQSGIGEGNCTEVPNGILLQTPKGVGKLNFTVNGVEINLGSTIFLQAVPADGMTIDVLEGQVNVVANGVSVFVPAGARVRISLDDAGIADGEPELLPYDEASVANTPVEALETPVEIVPAIDEEMLEALQRIPLAGQWQFVGYQTATGTCNEYAYDPETRTSLLIFTVGEDGTLSYRDAAAGTVVLTPSEPGVYASPAGSFTVLSPTQLEGSNTFYPYGAYEEGFIYKDCAITNHYQATWVGE